MTRYSYDYSVADRRVSAYIEFLTSAYGTDLDGLAEIAGATADEMRGFAAAEFEEKNAATLFQLARLTGISISWLCCETPVVCNSVCAAVTLEGEEHEAMMMFPNLETLANVMNNLPFTTSKGETITAVRIVDGDEAAEIGSADNGEGVA